MSSPKTRLLLVIVLALAAAVFYLVYPPDKGSNSPVPAGKPNVILIVSDALRQDVLGCYGGDALTPNIDWLADNGVLFENAYSTSPWTAPSAVSMFTGNYATTYGYSPRATSGRAGPVPIWVPDSAFLFTKSLKATGYVTSMKIENVNASLHNILQGCEPIADADSMGEVSERIRRIVGGEPLDSPAFKLWTGNELVDSPAYLNALAVLEYLLSLPSDKSFFLVHWILDPHYPYDPVEKFRSRIKVDEAKLSRHKHFYSRAMKSMAGLNAEEQQYIRDLYTAELESVDERIGFLLRLLKHKKLIENTYVIFTSDHGEMFGEHGLYWHGFHYYEELVRVPLIFFGPGLPKGKRVRENVSLLGLMPTLKDFLDAEHPMQMQGTSYNSLIFGDSTTCEFLYFDDVRESKQEDALLADNFKLICLKDGGFELYDLSNDAREDSNLAASLPQLVTSMYARVLTIRNENKLLQNRNVAVLDSNDVTRFSDAEKEELMKKLKALGYVQ